MVIWRMRQHSWQVYDWERNQGTRGLPSALWDICEHIRSHRGFELQGVMKRRTKIIWRKLPSAVSYTNIHWITNAQCIDYVLLALPQETWGQFFSVYYLRETFLHRYFLYFRQLLQSIHNKQWREIWNWTQNKHRESFLKLEGIFALTVSLQVNGE